MVSIYPRSLTPLCVSCVCILLKEQLQAIKPTTIELLSCCWSHKPILVLGVITRRYYRLARKLLYWRQTWALLASFLDLRRFKTKKEKRKIAKTLHPISQPRWLFLISSDISVRTGEHNSKDRIALEKLTSNFGQRLTRKVSIKCKMKGYVNCVVSPTCCQVVSRCYGTWCRLLITMLHSSTPHVKCPPPKPTHLGTSQAVLT